MLHQLPALIAMIVPMVSSPPIHPVFDLDHWLGVLEPLEPPTAFQLKIAREHLATVYDPEKMDFVPRTTPITDAEVVDQAWLKRLFANSITSPTALAKRERNIAEMPRHLIPAESVPTDVFVFGLGEPEHPAATKIGGLPYLPLDTPWPTFGHKPMTFIGQICFLDSLDILPNPPPGDVLLIFIPDEDELAKSDLEEDAATRLIWARLKDQPLLTADAVPEQHNPPTPCFGVRHRMPEYKGSHLYWPTESTRIAGSPAWIQGSYDEFPPPMRFLAALGGITSMRQNKHPLVNAPMSELTESQRKSLWMYLDVGQLLIFIDEHDTLTARWESY
tara:strand:+ start:1491 stop:2486 length:996 start_codon:yes stop_codon:yes gene_type:complete